MLRRYALLSMLLSALSVVRAQYDPSFIHYWAMETSFNPAAAGKDPMLNVTGTYNMSMTGFENNPKTMYIAADMPFYALKSYHGVGAQIVNDEIGLFSHKKLNIQYAYRFRMFGGMFSVGVQGGLLSENFDGSKVDLPEEGVTDEAFSKAEVTGTGFDLCAGLYYKHRHQISRITLWGVSDGGSWLNGWPIKGRTNYPLLFDRQYKAKPVVEQIMKLYK